MKTNNLNLLLWNAIYQGVTYPLLNCCREENEGILHIKKNTRFLKYRQI